MGHGEQEPYHYEKHDAFQSEFVKLAWMPGKIARRAGKYDAPACVGGAAPKLAVDEIGQPPEADADQHHTGDIVVYAQPVEHMPPRHKDNRNATLDHATVKRNDTLPQPPTT